MFSAISRVTGGYSRAAGLSALWNDYATLQDQRAALSAPPPPAPDATPQRRAMDNPQRRSLGGVPVTLPKSRRRSKPLNVLPGVSDRSDVVPARNVAPDEVPLSAAIPANHSAERPIRPDPVYQSRVAGLPVANSSAGSVTNISTPALQLLGLLASNAMLAANMACRQRAQFQRFQ